MQKWLKSPKVWGIALAAVAIIAVVAGFFGLSSRTARMQDERQLLNDQLASAQEQLDELALQLEEKGRQSEELKVNLTEARRLAGLSEVTGPGVVLTLKPKQVGGSVLYSVRDEDLLLLVNELNAAGAEAVSINGERMTAISEIRAAGPYISINTRSTSMPYTVQAIGDMNTLKAAMELYGGVLYNLSELLEIQLETVENITIPAYSGPISMEYAREVEK